MAIFLKSVKFWGIVAGLVFLIPLLIIQLLNVPVWKAELHTYIATYWVEFILIVIIYGVKIILYFFNIEKERKKAIKWATENESQNRFETTINGAAAAAYVLSVVISVIVVVTAVTFFILFFIVSGDEIFKWATWSLKTLFIIETFIYLWFMLRLIAPKRMN